MTGLVRLTDNLLTVKAGPLMDQSAIKPAVTIQQPGAVIDTQRVDNDVRLLSNAALDRQLSGGLVAADRAINGQTAVAPHSSVSQLSMAARVISAVLADLQSDAGPVRGGVLAWPSAGNASVPAIAQMLAQTVSQSGLFYESHLVDLVQGTRTLAELAQEPQARGSSPALAQAIASAAGAALRPEAATLPAATASASAAVAAGAADAAFSGLPKTALLTDGAGATSVPPGDNGPSPKADPLSPSGTPSPGHATTAPIDAYLKQAAQPWGDATPPPGHVPPSSASGSDELPGHAGHAPSAAAPLATTSGEMIHPQAVTLVHQQLDLLATSVFRWNGQAWPGVAMDWTIEAEPDDRSAVTPGEAEAPRRWATTVALELPQLGAVQLRVSLLDSTVRAALVADAASTRTQLTVEGSVLAGRLAAAGMTLEQFQVHAGEAA